MKKLIAILALAATSSAFGIISPVTETANMVELSFSIEDAEGAGPTVETYNFVNAFSGESITFSFRNREPRNGPRTGNVAIFSTDPSSGVFRSQVDQGGVGFGGQYVSGGYLVRWGIESMVREGGGMTNRVSDGGVTDSWSGRFFARAEKNPNSSVPDGGATLGLLGAAFAGMVFIKRRKIAKKS